MDLVNRGIVKWEVLEFVGNGVSIMGEESIGNQTEIKRRGGRREGAGRPPGSPNVPSPPQLLLDMQKVYKDDDEGTDTPGERKCRQLLKEDNGKFLLILKSLGEEHRKRIERWEVAQKEQREKEEAEKKAKEQT